MQIAGYSPHPSARRFDAGTPPVPNIYAGVAGLSLVEEVSVPAIEEHVRGLNTHLIEGLHALGATVVTPDDPGRRGPLVCVRSTDAGALVDALAQERIICSLRDVNLRVAPHLYNTLADIDTLLEALARRRHLLA
jgi:selenocysteine lyase/cysteine desulfurase